MSENKITIPPATLLYFRRLENELRRIENERLGLLNARHGAAMVVLATAGFDQTERYEVNAAEGYIDISPLYGITETPADQPGENEVQDE